MHVSASPNGPVAEEHPFAEVIVFSPAQASEDRPAFTYHIPDELKSRLETGALVVVPFGPRRLYGIVVALSDSSPVPETRPVDSLVDPQPVLTPEQIELARWMAHEYLAPLHECLELMLPPGLVGHADIEVAIQAEHDQLEDAANTEAQAKLLAVLQRRGPLRGAQLDRALPDTEWRAASQQLARRGIVARESFLGPPDVSPKRVRTVELVPAVDEETALEGLRSDRYPVILDMLRVAGGPVAVKRVYEETDASRYHLNKLKERGVITFGSQEVWRDPLADVFFVPTEPPPLTPDQDEVWAAIRSKMSSAEEAEPFLLHGVTGSGKTEIYLRAVAKVLERDQKAIVLVPEISLTPQTVARFAGRFPGRVAVLHSALTNGERYDTWRRARSGLVDIIVGPRSALFAPLSPLGLIVLDEEHDESYKQEAPRPRYHARDTAIELARLNNASLILGSATPSLESYHRAQKEVFMLLEMPRRIMGHTRRLQEIQARYHVVHSRYRELTEGATEARYLPLPPVQVVDLRAELQAGNRSIFSRALQRKMDEALDRGEQAILFLNRRGSATFVLCRDCGHVMECPRCDTPLTYHSRQNRLICHHCNYREPQPQHCPVCHSRRIRYFGLGTEQLEETVRERWPEARLLRWDRDTAPTHEAHTNILNRFASGAADVLVGTQMITKGLDLPLVTVVGVISADTALNLPDFRSSERTFQLLAQVAGRAGRGLLGGHVIIQTYHPDHYAVEAASRHDYEAFARQELAFRREQDYPPYRRLVKLVYEDTNFHRARARAEALAQDLSEALTQQGLPPTDLMGPAPPFFARLRGRYRWQILLRHPDPPAILNEINIPPGWHVEVDPVSVL